MPNIDLGTLSVELSVRSINNHLGPGRDLRLDNLNAPQTYCGMLFAPKKNYVSTWDIGDMGGGPLLVDIQCLIRAGYVTSVRKGIPVNVQLMNGTLGHAVCVGQTIYTDNDGIAHARFDHPPEGWPWWACIVAANTAWAGALDQVGARSTNPLPVILPNPYA